MTYASMFPLRTLEDGERVVATQGDERYPGVIDGVFEPDQGDFEYYVLHDDGSGSFWPRENLELEELVT